MKKRQPICFYKQTMAKWVCHNPMTCVVDPTMHTKYDCQDCLIS